MNVIACPLCQTPADSPHLNVDCQKIDYCPDGYDVVGDDFPILIARSGRCEIGHVAGKPDWRLRPCGCPITSAEMQPDGSWLVRGYKVKDGGVGLEPVEIHGRFLRTGVRNVASRLLDASS